MSRRLFCVPQLIEWKPITSDWIFGVAGFDRPNLRLMLPAANVQFPGAGEHFIISPLFDECQIGIGLGSGYGVTIPLHPK